RGAASMAAGTRRCSAARGRSCTSVRPSGQSRASRLPIPTRSSGSTRRSAASTSSAGPSRPRPCCAPRSCRRLCVSPPRNLSALGGVQSMQVSLGPVHHLRLTVTDINRSREFYTGLLGFQVAAESPPKDDPSYEATYPVLWGGIVMLSGNMLLGLRPTAPHEDRFDPDRVG